MKTLLKNIASIHSGIYVKPERDAEIRYLQVNHFNESGDLVHIPEPELQFNTSIAKHLLHLNDVVFAAKGTKNFAAQIEIEMAVASSSFLVVRIKDEYFSRINPAFIAWSLNQPPVLQQLKNAASGTSLPSIPKPALENIEISIPDVRKQNIILHIHELHQKEKQLKNKIELLHEKQLQQTLLNALTQN